MEGFVDSEAILEDQYTVGIEQQTVVELELILYLPDELMD